MILNLLRDTLLSENNYLKAAIISAAILLLHGAYKKYVSLKRNKALHNKKLNLLLNRNDQVSQIKSYL